MGKSTIIDKDKFKSAVVKAEENGPFENRSALFHKVTEIYNNLSPSIKITPSIVYLRINEFGISIKTPKGKKGRPSPETIAKMRASRSGISRNRASKLQKNPRYNEAIAAMRALIVYNKSERFLPLVDRIAKGSTVAERKLNCLQCVGFQPREITLCSDLGCPHWLLRPFSMAPVDQELTPEQILEGTEVEENIENIVE